MTDRDDKLDAPSALQGHREELATELLRVARAEPSSRVRSFLRRKWVAPLIALPLAATAGLAIAGELPPGDSDSPEPVPASERQSLFWGANAGYADCPGDVQRAIWALDEVEEYVKTPGYPVAGCPTLEALESDGFFLALFERVKRDPELRSRLPIGPG